MATIYTLKVMFISWMIGHASTLLLRRAISINKLVQLNFVRNEKINKLVGVGVYKWVLANSFFRYFNRRLRLSVKKPTLNELIELREAMTYAETVHLIGFAYVLGTILMNIIDVEHQSTIAALFAVNILVNLYPVLVQQMNKRRIDCLINSIQYRRLRVGDGNATG